MQGRFPFLIFTQCLMMRSSAVQAQKYWSHFADHDWLVKRTLFKHLF